MPDKAISNTSPLLYLHRCGGLAWLPRLFTLVCVPGAVAFELAEGKKRGFDVPNPEDHSWMKIMDPQATPSEWFAANKAQSDSCHDFFDGDNHDPALFFTPQSPEGFP